MTALTLPLRAQSRLPVGRLGGSLGPPYADPALAERPVPRLPDGTVDLGGVWRNGGDDPDPDFMDPLLLPWAKQLLGDTEGA